MTVPLDGFSAALLVYVGFVIGLFVGIGVERGMRTWTH